MTTTAFAPPPVKAAPPLPTYGQQQTNAQSCQCQTGYALTCEQGQTLSTQITLTVTDPVTGLKTPVDVTGAKFEFTAKTAQGVPDNDPSTIKVDWQETNTPTKGITWLTVPAATTQTMQAIAYVMQIRMVSASGVVTPLASGTLTITEPVSSRF